MRRFFDQFKKNSVEINQTEQPSLPVDESYSELIKKTNRGFLAKKIGQYLGLDSLEGDKLFYFSLSTSSFSHVTKYEDQHTTILYFSEKMLDWYDQNLDVVEQIKNLNMSMIFQNALLKAYEIHQKDLFSSKLLVNPPKKSQQSQEEKIEWKIYRDVMFSATHGQFLLITENEAASYKKGNIFCEGIIKESSDIPINRNMAKESLEKMGINKAKMMSWLLVLSEAITNTIKHAENGKMTLVENHRTNEIYFIIEDNGPGFSLEDLPKKILLEGYSTKRSMGQGFTLMRKMANKILLSTSPSGSTIILIFVDREAKVGRVNEESSA
ncbi:ATP-binding protein [Niallia sp. Krafla_26]|uniref:ATP-binding protein n=1 Tax=Niallia sp. Krafla_26 TaxID=3064703 RepID=UPI003D183BC0